MPHSRSFSKVLSLPDESGAQVLASFSRYEVHADSGEVTGFGEDFRVNGKLVTHSELVARMGCASTERLVDAVMGLFERNCGDCPQEGDL